MGRLVETPSRPGRSEAGWGWRCHWTMSTAATSNWSAGSPSSWSGFVQPSTHWPGRRAWLTGSAHWRSALESLTLTSAAELWQAAQLRSELASVLEAAGERAAKVTLTLADLRALLADRLRGRPTRANFRTGSLTMCTLVPMRSVPHRVVCLLGLDDGAFPRQPTVDGDDVLLRDPLTGERDARSEDRQLLLDAILSRRRPVGDHLQRGRRAY